MAARWTARKIFQAYAAMIITPETKYTFFQDFEHTISDESSAELKKAAEQYFKPCHALTVAEFFGVLNGHFELLGDISDPTVLQVYWQKRFREFVDEFSTACNRLKIHPDDEAELTSGCVNLTGVEHMLVFLRDYFGLPSFEAAGERTLSEYLTARKDKFNEWRIMKNREAIQARKLKQKR